MESFCYMLLLQQPAIQPSNLRVASTTYNSVNTRACAAEIQYQVTNDEDGMPMWALGARLQSNRRDARAEPIPWLAIELRTSSARAPETTRR